jgi:hypothetical protein
VLGSSPNEPPWRPQHLTSPTRPFAVTWTASTATSSSSTSASNRRRTPSPDSQSRPQRRRRHPNRTSGQPFDAPEPLEYSGGRTRKSGVTGHPTSRCRPSRVDPRSPRTKPATSTTTGPRKRPWASSTGRNGSHAATGFLDLNLLPARPQDTPPAHAEILNFVFGHARQRPHPEPPGSTIGVRCLRRTRRRPNPDPLPL